jgi:preprotein translocase subunit SecD
VLVRVAIALVALVSSALLGLYPIAARYMGIERPAWLVSKALKLGLDLQGGVDLVVTVQSEVALRRETEAAIDRLRDEMRAAGITLPDPVADSPTTFSVSLSETGRSHRTAAAVDASFLRTDDGTGVVRYSMRPEVAAALMKDAVDQALETIGKRIDELGVSEPSLSRLETRNAIEIQLPGVTNVARAKTLLGATGLLEFAIVEDGPSPAADRWPREVLTKGMKVVEDHSRPVPPGEAAAFYLVRTTGVTGAEIRTARPALDQHQRPAVAFSLTAPGAQRFADVTGANVGRSLAIVLDDRVASVAQIEGRIRAEGQIAGAFTATDTQNLAVLLRSGTLKGPLTYLSEHTVSASLGADAVRAGITASAAALAIVAVFMVVYYRWAGVNAVLSMLANLIVLLGLLAYSGTVMTLPGIAGFVLTIGIGVDSSVLIFERIKEELADGRSVRSAIATGYSRVFRTLLDTHIAALIAAALLFQFGTGPIRGFAVTLSAGLASNLFTSTFVSRTIWDIFDVGESSHRASLGI